MPRVNDGALLFLQTMLAKMKSPDKGGSRIAIIFNGSPLSNGDCGQGESEIRRWILENDWLDAVVMMPDQLFYNTAIFTYIWLLRNEKPSSHRRRIMLIDGRQQFEKEPKSFGNKRNRMTDAHRQWIEERYHKGWKEGFDDKHVKLFTKEDFAFHKAKVVYWQTDVHDQPAVITEPYEKAFTAANLSKELAFYDSQLSFRVRIKTSKKRKTLEPAEATVEFVLKPGDSARKKLTDALGDDSEVLSVEWTHRHYVQDDEYIPFGKDIPKFLNEEIAKPIIRWKDSECLGYEMLPNKYFYKYQAPIPAKELLAEFWRLEKAAEQQLERLAR
jgi:type I restriction enzyme M protein